MTILLICREGESRQVYLAELSLPGVVLVCVQAFMQFFHREIYCPLNGILVDMPTYMKSTEEEKLQLTELGGIFPALRIKCNEISGEVRTLPFGSAYPANTALTAFVHTYCSPFSSRRIRSGERFQQYQPALLNSFAPVAGDPVTKSATVNISPGGCFLICFEPWNVGDRGWLILPELKKAEPILVEICWVRGWGKSFSLPGMGMKFIDCTDAQSAELGTMGCRNFMLEEKWEKLP